MACYVTTKHADRLHWLTACLVQFRNHAPSWQGKDGKDIVFHLSRSDIYEPGAREGGGNCNDCPLTAGALPSLPTPRVSAPLRNTTLTVRVRVPSVCPCNPKKTSQAVVMTFSVTRADTKHLHCFNSGDILHLGINNTTATLHIHCDGGSASFSVNSHPFP